MIAQRELELLRGLAVRAEAGRPGGGERCVAEHRGTIPAPLGVMCQPPVVVRPRRRQFGERPRMETAAQGPGK